MKRAECQLCMGGTRDAGGGGGGNDGGATAPLLGGSQ